MRRCFPSNLFVSDRVASNALKELGAIYKKGGPELDPDWMWFVDIHTSTGYVDPKTPIDLDEEAKSWVEGPEVYNSSMTTGRVSRHAFLDKLILLGKKKRVEPISVKEFLMNPSLYATAGSGRGLPRLTVEARYYDVDRREWKEGSFRLGSSKWAGLIASTPDALVKLIFKQSKQRNVMFIKIDEKGGLKLRSIVVGDIAVYMRMAYLNYYISKILSDCPWLPVTWDVKRRHDHIEEGLKNSRDERIVHIPIDQTAFDKHVSLDLILDVVSWLTKIAYEASGYDDEVRRVGEELYYSMDGGALVVEETGHSFPIERGVISGWLWTALLGGLCNYVQFKEICQAMFILDSDIHAHYHQGDDIDISVYKYETAVAIAEGYNAYGLEINPIKFWIERDRNEFLRLVYSKYVRGYPARLISGLLYLKPGPPSDPEETWYTQLDSWIKAISRGAKPDIIERMVLEEAARVFGINKTVAYNLLYTPRPYGGGGWGPKWPTELFGLDILQARRPVVLSSEAPLFSNFSSSDKNLLLNEFLSPFLPKQKPIVKKLEKRDFPVTMQEVFIVPFDLTEINQSPPLVRPKWKRDVSVTERALYLAKYIKKLINIDDLVSYLSNPYDVKKTLNELGRRNFIDWFKADPISTPLSITNPIMITMGVHRLAWMKWYLIKKIGLTHFRAIIEKYSQSIMKHVYSESGFLYGH
jgi:hypothetical protein